MSPPQAHPLGFAIFSLLQVYSPPLGLQKETIPHPELLFDLICIFCYIFLIHIKAKRHVFTTFMSVFPEIFREGYGCHNENENEEETLFKKRLLDRTLHENTKLNLCFFPYIKSLVFVFI